MLIICLDIFLEKRNETTVFEPTKSSKPKKLIKSMVADKKQTSMKLRYRSKKVLIRVADLETQLREMQVRLNSVENRIDQLIKNIRIRPKNNPTSIQMSNVKAVPTAPPIQNIQLPSSVVGNPQAPGESMRGGTARQGLVEDDFDY